MSRFFDRMLPAPLVHLARIESSSDAVLALPAELF